MALFRDDDLHERCERLEKSYDILIEQQNNLLNEVKLLSEGVTEVKSALTQTNEEKQEASNKIEKEVTKISETNEVLERAIRSFKDLQHRIQLHSFEKINEGIQRSVETLKKDTEKYSDAKLELQEVIERMNDLKNEIIKFTTISRKISETDYDLTKFTNKVNEQDKEKLRLMKEVDSLQRLVGSLRRKMRH